jgi:hypothetical protein
MQWQVPVTPSYYGEAEKKMISVPGKSAEKSCRDLISTKKGGLGGACLPSQL